MNADSNQQHPVQTARKGPRRVAVAGIVVGALLAGAYLKTASDTRRVWQELDAALAAAPRRWDRPVLRGTAVEENGAACQARRLGELRRAVGNEVWSETSSITTGMVTGERPMPEWVLAKVVDQGGVQRALRALRGCAAARWAWGSPHQGADRELARANRLLLAWMTTMWTSDPAECLRIGTDLIRLEQDAGAGLPTSDDVETMPMVATAMLACSHFAEGADVATARDELLTLVRTPTPFRLGVAHGLLAIAGRLRSEEQRHAWIDARTLWRRPSRLRDISSLVGAARRWSARAGLEARFSIDVALDPAVRRTHLVKAAAHEIEVRGMLRALTRALAELAEHRTSQSRLRNVALTTELQDPFGAGEPLLSSSDGAIRTIWSRGINGRDDAGSGDDIALQVAMVSTEEARQAELLRTSRE